MTTLGNHPKNGKWFGWGEAWKSVSLKIKIACKPHVPPLFQPYADKPAAGLPRFQKPGSQTVGEELSGPIHWEKGRIRTMWRISLAQTFCPELAVARLRCCSCAAARTRFWARCCNICSSPLSAAPQRPRGAEFSSSAVLFPVAIPWLLSIKKGKPKGMPSLRAPDKASTAIDSTTSLNFGSWMKDGASIGPN